MKIFGKIVLFKGAPKLYFMRQLYLVIILFIMGLSKSVFSTYSFRELGF